MRRAPLLLGLALLLRLVAPPASAADAPPAKQESIYSGEATGILGRPIIGPDGEQVGRISDVLVDEGGQPRAAVIDIGGFLGVGQRRIAVVWRALHFSPADPNPTIRLEMTMDQIADVPEWKPAEGPGGPPATMAAPPKPKP